jgi:hypothetical protein
MAEETSVKDLLSQIVAATTKMSQDIENLQKHVDKKFAHLESRILVVAAVQAQQEVAGWLEPSLIRLMMKDQYELALSLLEAGILNATADKMFDFLKNCLNKVEKDSKDTAAAKLLERAMVVAKKKGALEGEQGKAVYEYVSSLHNGAFEPFVAQLQQQA